MARSKGILLPGQPNGPEWLPVTSPLQPAWEDLAPRLQAVLERRWLTNNGLCMRELEAALRDVLGAPHALLMTNGTLALELLLRETIDGGEVVLPAYSFPATWNLIFDSLRYTPRFVDIGSDCTIDPAAAAAAIGPRTTAILGVHAYGVPCDHAALSALAGRHGLALLYDAAHCTGVTVDGAPLGGWGTGSAWSFHATKVFNTLEGGAVSTTDSELAERLTARRSFGQTAGQQISFGTNAKMDEFRAAFGLATLPLVASAIAARGRVAARYDAALEGLPVRTLHQLRPTDRYSPNHAYYPVFFADRARRDAADGALRQAHALPRRYFDDALFEGIVYGGAVRREDVPRAAAACGTVLCLPIHHRMTPCDVDHVTSVLARALTRGATP